MKKIIDKIKKFNITDWLFLCIIINLLPVILLEEFDITSRIYSALVAFGYLIQTIIMLIVIKDKIKEITKKEIRLFILFFGLQILGQGFNLVFLNSFHIKDLINLSCVVVNIFIFIIAINHFNVEKQQIQSLFKKMIILGVIASIYNIIKNGVDFTTILSLRSSHSVSFSSFFPNRNQFGIFMLITILCNSYLISLKRTKSNTLIQILFIFNAIMTMSRNCIMGILVLYAFRIYFALKNRKTKKITKKQIVITIVILSVLIVSSIALLNNDKIFDTLNRLFFRLENLKTGSGRFKVWNNSIHMCLNNNMITGVGRFRALQINQSVYNSSLESFHSVYFETFATYGIVGLVGFFCLVVYILKKIFKNKDLNLKSLLITSMFMFLILSILETLARFSMGYVDTISLIMFFTIPIISSNIKEEKATSVKSNRKVQLTKKK